MKDVTAPWQTLAAIAATNVKMQRNKKLWRSLADAAMSLAVDKAYFVLCTQADIHADSSQNKLITSKMFSLLI